MRRLSGTILLSLLVLPAVAIEWQELNNQHRFAPIIGSYSGSVFVRDQMVLAITAFYQEPDGMIEGTYRLDDQKGEIIGQLSNLRWDGQYTLMADWTDRYGSGSLRFLFNSTFSEFYGFWGSSELDMVWPWHGQLVDELNQLPLAPYSPLNQDAPSS